MSSYSKEPFTAEDIKQLNIKYPSNLFQKKELWFAIVIVCFVVMAIMLFCWIIVLLISNFQAPKGGYQNRILGNWIIIPIVLVISVLIKIQNTIDHKLGYKKVGLFPVTHIVNLVTVKILILDGWRIFRIDKYSPIFQDVNKGFIIRIEKTATSRLIYDIEIDKSKGY